MSNTILLNQIISLIKKPPLILGGLAGLSLFSLASALTAQYGFDLQPCSLCLIQRVPFSLTALIGLGGLVLFLKTKNNSLAAGLVALCGIIFAAGAVIAFYHVGVEQHWWTSILESCSAGKTTGNAADILAQIEKKAAVPCDQIPWQMFGISMAGYNVAFSGGLAVFSLLSAYLMKYRA